MALKEEVVHVAQSLEKIQEQQTARLRETLSKVHVNNQNTKIKTNIFSDDLDLKTNAESGEANCYNEHSTNENTESVTAVVTKNRKENYFQKEVERLQLQLSKKNSEVKQKDKEIEQLRQSLDEERKIMSEAGLTVSVTQKIVEISRKNRYLHSELGREKHKTRQLQIQVSELNDLNRNHEACIEESKKKLSSDPTMEEKQKEAISKLEEQLMQAKQKVIEHCNHVQLLKQDLKLAQKVLIKEVGESATISNLAVAGEGWRGRAQIILTLQNKVAELQKQIETHSQTSRLSAVGHKTSTLAESKQKTAVHKIETENKQKLQELKTELQTLHSEQGEFKQTIKALKSRNQTLTLELKEYKTQVNLVTSELKEKEKIISCLEEKLVKAEKKISKPNENDDTLRLLRSQLSHSNGERHRLEQTVSQLQEKLAIKQQNSTLPITNHSFPLSSQEHSTHSLINDTVELSSSEASSLHLPPIVSKSKQKKNTNKSSCIRSSISAGNVPGQPEKMYSSEEFDKIVSLCRVTEVERDRLLGLSQLLQQRLDAAYTELGTTKQQLMNSIKGGGQELSNITARTKLKPPVTKEEDNKFISELQKRLSLLEDENNVLKETLRITREQKLKDMKILQNLLHETKQNLRKHLL